MARSNTGGTRGFIRGRVADDLYQVTRTKNGKKIQLVRSVESGRINNNTIMQAGARMMMALLMGCLKQFKEIVDHSFETIPYGQLSIAHFVEVNMSDIQTDCRDNWEFDNRYDYPVKGEPLIRVGAFIMAEGGLILPSCLAFAFTDQAHNIGGLRISLGVANPTFGDLRAALAARAEDYITTLLFQFDSENRSNNAFLYTRAYLAHVPDNTPIKPANVEQMFTYDGNAARFISCDVASGNIYIAMQKPTGWQRGEIVASCIILSKWDGKKWCRNNARFTNVDPAEPWRDLMAPNDVFQSWFPSYDPDNPFNPYR